MRAAFLGLSIFVFSVSDARGQGNPRDFERAGPAAERQMYYAQVRREVHETLLSWQTAWAKDDAKLLATMYAEDSSFFPSATSRLSTREAIRDYYARILIDAGAAQVQMVDFGTSGDLAYLVANILYETDGSAGRPIAQIARTDMFVLRRRSKGGWEIHSHVSRDDPHAPAARP
jgi:uncharacterized protein (TIGR02246 family)